MLTILKIHQIPKLNIEVLFGLRGERREQRMITEVFSIFLFTMEHKKETDGK